MKTNIKLVLENKNLSGVELLNYYKEEIWLQYDIYKFLYKESFTLKDEYEKYLNKEKQKIQRKKIKKLVQEFLKLTKYILHNLQKNSVLYELGYEDDIKKYLIILSNHIYFVKDELRFEEKIKNFIINIIGIMCRYYEVIPLMDSEEQNQKLINDYYIEELNRLLDEKEAKLYELEVKSFQDQQDINALIVENQDLKRVLEINREGEE